MYSLMISWFERELGEGELGTVLLSAFRRNKRGLKTVPDRPYFPSRWLRIISFLQFYILDGSLGL